MSKIILTEQASPTTPGTDKGEIYIKIGGLLYFQNDDGTEFDLTVGGGGGNSFGVVTGDSGTATSDSSTDTLTITGGEGIVTTASDAPEDVNIVIDLSEFVTDTGIASGDLIAFRDISPAANNLITFANFEAALTLSALAGSVTDDQVPNTITLDNITQITTRSHTSLSDIGSNAHSAIDTHLAKDYVTTGNEPHGIPLTVLNKTTNPGTTDDGNNSSGAGVFKVGSFWVNVTADTAYICVDNSTSAAVWVETTQTPAGNNGFGVVTGDSGTATSDSGNDTLTITGGEGIVTAASDAPEDVNIVLDLSELATDTAIASGDLIVFRDISPAANNLITWANLQSAITTVGTIATGTWQGNVIDHERGGLEADVSAGDGFVEIKGGSTTVIKSNQAASTAPGTGNDNTQGYAIGSVWIDTTADKAYVALDVSTGAAVWTETTQAGGGGNSFGVVTGDSGTATSDSSNDTLTITGGEGIVTTASDAPEDVNIVLDLSELTTDTVIADGDLIVFRDISPAANNLITKANFESALSITQGKQTIWIPASAMIPEVTSPCSDLVAYTTLNNRDYRALSFDAGADEAAQFDIAFPKRWNEGNITFQVFWTVDANVTTGVAWALEARANADNEGMETAFGTPIVVTDDSQGRITHEEVYVTSESANLLIGGVPAADELSFFRIFRDVSDGNDDTTQDARLIGIKLFWTTDAENDD